MMGDGSLRSAMNSAMRCVRVLALMGVALATLGAGLWFAGDSEAYAAVVIGESSDLPVVEPAVTPVVSPTLTSWVYLPRVASNEPGQLPVMSPGRAFVPFVSVPVVASSTGALALKPTASPSPKPTIAPTAIPTPTATPLPARSLTAAQQRSKLGIGVYEVHASNAALDNLVRARPAVVLLQDPDIGFARDVRRLLPEAFIIGRTFLAEQPLDNPEQQGIALADRVASIAVPYNGLIDAWMGYNEPVSHNDFAAYHAYNRLQVAFAKRLQDNYGVAAVAGNDAPGAIEPADYVKYFGDAIRASRYFGLHAYSAEGENSLRPQSRYYSLRYRLVHEALQAAGIRDVQMVLTEVGLGDGWWGRISENALADEFIWLESEMKKDDYAIGFAIFGIFGYHEWVDFNIRDTSIIDIMGRR